MEDVPVYKNGEHVSKEGDDSDLTTADEHGMDIDRSVDQPEAESESAIQFTHFESVAENETVNGSVAENGVRETTVENNEEMEENPEINELENDPTETVAENVDDAVEDQQQGNEENEDAPTKLSQLPVSKIRKIMKFCLGDDSNEVRIISKEAAFLVGQATELFVAAIAQETSKLTQSSKKKTMTIQHLTATVADSEIFSFLEGTMVPDYDF